MRFVDLGRTNHPTLWHASRTRADTSGSFEISAEGVAAVKKLERLVGQ